MQDGELMQEFHFPTWVNKFTLLLVATAVTVGGYLATCLFAAIHPTIINVGHQPKQPVPFSHKLHAGQLKLEQHDRANSSCCDSGHGNLR